MSKIKNVVILKNYEIQNKSFSYHSRCFFKHKNLYNKMQAILEESIQTHILDIDEIIIDKGKTDTDQSMFKHHMQKLYEHWCIKPMNILYCDLDVLFVNKIDIFGADLHDFYMPVGSCSIRYYPHSMRQDTWNIILNALETWNTVVSKWDFEQDIYTKAHQHANKFTLSPNWMISDIPLSMLDDSKIFDYAKKYQILHLHSTNNENQEKCVEVMDRLNKWAINR